MRFLALLLPFMFASSAALAKPTKCPTITKDPVVFGIGGSTMSSPLGDILKAAYAKHNITFKYSGKASSGLARPDFHDWPKLAPGEMKRNKPDIVIVSLGTNDYQALNTKQGPIRQDDPNWEKVYGERVDALLNALAGENKERLVIWSGPYAFDGKNAVVRAPIVNRIMKERVEAFAANGGKAVFHDVYALTSDNGKPLSKTKLPGRDKVENIRRPDNIHLTADAVRELLAKPMVEETLPCFKK